MIMNLKEEHGAEAKGPDPKECIGFDSIDRMF